MDLQELVTVSENKRDSAWENQFFTELTAGNIDLLFDEPQSGPDGWPYLLAKTHAGSTEPVKAVLQWLKEKGIGLVINPQKEYPDYVFTYGMIWHFLETGLFFRATQTQSNGQAMLRPEDILSSGNPPESYLPGYVRNILREFFHNQGVLLPRILALNLKQGHTELVFSLEGLGNPQEQEHQGVAEAISWFLPPHFSIMIASEKGLPEFHNI